MTRASVGRLVGLFMAVGLVSMGLVGCGQNGARAPDSGSGGLDRNTSVPTGSGDARNSASAVSDGDDNDSEDGATIHDAADARDGIGIDGIFGSRETRGTGGGPGSGGMVGSGGTSGAGGGTIGSGGTSETGGASGGGGTIITDGGMGPYVVSADGLTVIDMRTMLEWQRDGSGARAGTGCKGELCTWEGATAYCAGLSLNGSGWRLPTKDELVSLLDMAQRPRINQAAFPNTPSEWFWTSSPFAANPGTAWGVNFFNSILSNNSMRADCRVRCVRDSQ